MVGGISSFTIPALSYSAASGGKMSVPVDSSALIYSHFQHVSGTAAPEGTQGISINKLNLLDVLISQANRIKKTGAGLPAAPLLPPEGIDAVIENFNSRIRQVQSASETTPYIPSPNVQTGSLFSLIT